MARILCVSDLHLGSSDKKDIYGESINEKLIDSIGVDKRKLLVDSLISLEPKVDIIVFCGDYVTGKDSNEDSKKSYDDFLALLELFGEHADEIFSDEDIPIHNRIVITPGNHDINRENKTDVLTNFKEKMNGYMTPFYKDKRSSFSKNGPIFIFDTLKLIIACISTVDNSATTNEEVVHLMKAAEQEENISNDFKNSLNAYLNKNKISDIPTVTEESLEKFSKINKKLNKKEKYEDYNKIIVTHHPLLSGIERGKTLKAYNYTVGGFEFLEQALMYGYNMFLHGHLHEFSCVEFKDYKLGDRNGVQIGVPDMVTNFPDKGVVIIDTDTKNIEKQIFQMMLDSIPREFRQQQHIEFKPHEKQPTIGIENMSYILTDAEIVGMIKEQRIIKNGDASHVEAASYDCSLGYHYKKISGNSSESAQLIELKSEDDKPAEIKIKPNETVLIYTYEEFNIPDNMVLHASPIGTWMRRGLRTQISYFVDPGFEGEFCFPVTNESNEDIVITSREAIISIEFVKLHKKVDKSWKIRHPDKVERRKTNY